MSADRRSIDASSATGTADGDADAVVVEELETGDRLLVGEAMMMLFSSGSKKVAPPTAGYYRWLPVIVMRAVYCSSRSVGV